MCYDAVLTNLLGYFPCYCIKLCFRVVYGDQKGGLGPEISTVSYFCAKSVQMFPMYHQKYVTVQFSPKLMGYFYYHNIMEELQTILGIQKGELCIKGPPLTFFCSSRFQVLHQLLGTCLYLVFFQFDGVYLSLLYIDTI